MPHTTFTFRLDDALKAAFAETARAEDRTAAQLLRVLMREAVGRRGPVRPAPERFPSVNYGPRAQRPRRNRRSTPSPSRPPTRWR